MNEHYQNNVSPVFIPTFWFDWITTALSTKNCVKTNILINCFLVIIVSHSVAGGIVFNVIDTQSVGYSKTIKVALSILYHMATGLFIMQLKCPYLVRLTVYWQLLDKLVIFEILGKVIPSKWSISYMSNYIVSSQ